MKIDNSGWKWNGGIFTQTETLSNGRASQKNLVSEFSSRCAIWATPSHLGHFGPFGQLWAIWTTLGHSGPLWAILYLTQEEIVSSGSDKDRPTSFKTDCRLLKPSVLFEGRQSLLGQNFYESVFRTVLKVHLVRTQKPQTPQKTKNQSGPNGQKWPRVAQMAQSGRNGPEWPKWPKVAQSGPNGPEWPKWPKWPSVAQLAQSGPEWPKWPRVAQMAHLLENSETNFFLGRPVHQPAHAA